MWLERFGNVDQNVFFGFCAVVFVVVVVIVVSVFTRIFSTIPSVPGQSLTFFLIPSSTLICASVLVRGVQPDWTAQTTTLQTMCQIVVPLVVLGYTLFAAALFVRVWILLLALRWEKNTVEWLGHFILWVILVVAAVLVIIWVASFTPNIHPASVDNFTAANESDELATAAVYECRGWLEDGSMDVEQFAWRVTMSCYLAALLLLTVVALPFYACIPMLGKQSRWVRVNVVSVVAVVVNALVCVVVCLIVWFQYAAKATPVGARDSTAYAIIGTFQLWMILVADAACLVTELMTSRTSPSDNVNGLQKHSFSSNYSAKRELSTNDAARRDVTADRDDYTAGGSVRSNYVDDYDDDLRRTSNNRWSSSGGHQPEELQEIDSGHETYFDHGSSRNSAFTPHEDDSTLF